MTDRHRFSRRATELRAFADRIEPLAKMPDRATCADIQLAADLAKQAANDLDELVKATPPGCICRRIENDYYSYLDYAEECIHHRQYYFLREQLKADYAKMEQALKNETRLKLVIAALQAQTVHSNDPVERMAKLAIELADEVLRQLGSKVKKS
jgi:hypothetical protein